MQILDPKTGQLTEVPDDKLTTEQQMGLLTGQSQQVVTDKSPPKTDLRLGGWDLN